MTEGRPESWGDDITDSSSMESSVPLLPPPAGPVAGPPGAPGGTTGAAAEPAPTQTLKASAQPMGAVTDGADTSRSDPPDEGLVWSRRSTGITLGVLAVIGIGAFWYLTRDTPVKLEVDGRPIANAETILDRSEAAFTALAKADGATPSDDAGCWFAPADGESVVSRGPQLACGPVLLGVSGTSKPWVLGRVSYSASSTGDATGTFDSFDGVGDPDTGGFARPDSRGVPSTSGLDPATSGVRADDGRRIVGDQAFIDEAD